MGAWWSHKSHYLLLWDQDDFFHLLQCHTAIQDMHIIFKKRLKKKLIWNTKTPNFSKVLVLGHRMKKPLISDNRLYSAERQDDVQWRQRYKGQSWITCFSNRAGIWRVRISLIFAEILWYIVSCQLSHDIWDIAIRTQVLETLMSTT